MRHFVADLPVLVGIWVGSLGFASIVLALTEGRSLLSQLAESLPFLPMAVPLLPLLWLWRFARPPDRTLRTAGIGLGWFVLTAPLAILAAVALSDLLTP